MAKVDFNEILSLQVGSAPEPKPIPGGTYYGEISELPSNRLAKTKEGDKPVVSVKFALKEPGEDVDTDELAEAGGLVNNNGQPKIVSRDFWLDDSSRYQLDRFLATFGLEGSYTEAFQELPGKEVMVFITLDTYTTKSGEERTINNVQRCFARE